MPRVTFIDESWSIEANAEEVFDLLEDVERWPEWASAIKSSSRSGSGPLSPGETLQFTPDLAVPLPLRSTIRTVEGPERLSWGVEVPGFDIEHRFLLEPDGSTCQLRQVETANGLLAPVALPFKSMLHGFDRKLGDDLQEYFRSGNA